MDAIDAIEFDGDDADWGPSPPADQNLINRLLSHPSASIAQIAPIASNPVSSNEHSE